MVFIKKDKFKNPNARYYFSRYKHLPFATQSALTLSTTAITMLKELFDTNETYHKAGVILSEIIPEDQKQFQLFEEENPKHERLMKVMDTIRNKTGERKIKLGNQDLNRTWKMKQNFLSKKYTTNLNHLLEVKC